MKLNGRVALVTGGARGIGRAIAHALAAEGASVVVNYRQDAAGAATTLASLSTVGRHAAVAADVSSPEGVDSLFVDVRRRYGRLDILVNNAGWTVRADPEHLTALDSAALDRMLATNVLSVFHASLRAVTLMREVQLHESAAWRGSIINVSSNSVRSGSASNLFYIATKAAVNSLTTTFAKHYGDVVRVNAVAPGLVRTDLTADSATGRFESVANATPLGRICIPEDVAALVMSLACDVPFLSGQVIAVDGGRTSP